MLATAALLLSDASAFALGEKRVGGASMSLDKTIVRNASAALNLTTLVAAVQAAGREAEVTTSGVEQSNGVVQVVNRVLLP